MEDAKHGCVCFVRPPEEFSFNTTNWLRWKRKFLRYRSISLLNKESNGRQVDVLLYVMGEPAEAIFQQLEFGTNYNAAVHTFSEVMDAFDLYFETRSSSRYQRMLFGQRMQLADESVEDYVYALRCLAAKCEFEKVCSVEDRIADQLVIGLNDRSVQLQLQSDLLSLQDMISLACNKKFRNSTDSTGSMEGERLGSWTLDNWSNSTKQPAHGEEGSSNLQPISQSSLSPVVPETRNMSEETRPSSTPAARQQMLFDAQPPLLSPRSETTITTLHLDDGYIPNSRRSTDDATPGSLKTDSIARPVNLSTKSDKPSAGTSKLVYEKEFMISLQRSPLSQIRPDALSGHPMIALQHSRVPSELQQSGMINPKIYKIHTTPLMFAMGQVPPQLPPSKPLPKRVRKPLAIVDPDTQTVVNESDVISFENSVIVSSSADILLPPSLVEVEHFSCIESDNDDVRSKLKDMVTSSLSRPTVTAISEDTASHPTQTMNGVASIHSIEAQESHRNAGQISLLMDGEECISAPRDDELMPPPGAYSGDILPVSTPSPPEINTHPSTSLQSDSGSSVTLTPSVSPKKVAFDMSNIAIDETCKTESHIVPGRRKVYSRGFLMSLQKALLSQQKPKGLPNFTDIIKSHPHTSREMRPSGRRDLNPAYFKGAASVRSVPDTTAHRDFDYSMLTRDEGVPCVRSLECESALLHRAENAWKPVFRTSPAASAEKTLEQKEETLLRVFRGYLNKITPQTFQKIVAQVLSLEVETHNELGGIAVLAFETAIHQPLYAVTYANLCHKLSKDLMVGQTGFRKLLYIQCQREFESSAADDEVVIAKRKAVDDVTVERKAKLEEEYELFAGKARRRKLGNIRFIGELYKLQMLTGKIMHDCIVSLLKSTDEEGYECLCVLLRTIGKFLDNPKAQNLMGQYFNKMKELSENTKKVSTRVRFALKDIIELRENNWKPRQQQQDNNPKTIAEVHAEAALEAHETKAMIENSNIPSRGSQSRNPPPRSQRRGDDDSGAGPSGWNVVPSMKTHQRIDPQKLRLTQQAGRDTVTLGPPRGFGGGSGWGRGSSGSGKNTPPQQQEERASTPTNRFSALRDGGGGGKMERSSSGHRLPTGRGSMGRGINRSGASNRMGGTPRGSMEKERSSALATARQFSRTSGSRGPSRENSVEGRRNMRTPTPTRPDSRRTSDSSSKVVVAPVAVKQLSRDEWETKMKSIIDEYLHKRDLKEMMDYIRDLDAQSNKNLITECSINYTLERTGSARKTVGQMLAELIKHELLPLDLHLKGIDTVLEIADDLAIDIPNVWEYLAQLIAPMFTVASIPLVKLDTVCASLRSIGKAATLAAEILHEASSLSGHVEVGKRCVESSLQWTDFLPEGENLEEFISSKRLEYTLHTNVTKSSTSTSQSNVDIATTLEKFLQAGATNDVIFDWAESTLSEDRRSDQSFIKCLTTSVSKACIDDGNFFNEDKLKSRTPLLAKYLDGKREREESALIALEELMNKLEHPANLLSDFCYALIDEDLIADESFFLWEKKSKSGIAVKSVGIFFDWLRNSQLVD